MNVYEKIKRYLNKKYMIPNDQIEKTSTFDSLAIDSLDRVELIIDMEIMLDIDIPEDAYFENLEELSNFIEDVLTESK